MKKLFLDDFRVPKDCAKYMGTVLVQLYNQDDWTIVRSYDEFCKHIMEHGLPDLISYDHDLADEHYFPLETSDKYKQLISEGNLNEFYASSFVEKTGYDCAKWLVEYCMDYRMFLPEFIVHSMNPSGAENIRSLLVNYKKYDINDREIL